MRPPTTTDGGDCSRISTTTRTRLSRCSPKCWRSATSGSTSSCEAKRDGFRASLETALAAEVVGELGEAAPLFPSALLPALAGCERRRRGESRPIAGNGGARRTPRCVRGARRSAAGVDRRAAGLARARRLAPRGRRRTLPCGGRREGRLPGNRQRRGVARATAKQGGDGGAARKRSRTCRSSPRRCIGCAGSRIPATRRTRGRSSNRCSRSCRAPPRICC